MIPRRITAKIKDLRKKFPVITLTGARQTGKTTLLKSIYTDLPYVNLEDIDNREIAVHDPRGFLSNYPDGAVIDEAQQAPKLFSYIQQVVDSSDAHFVLSGSQNFQLLEKITQSLAGRTAILYLHPFSYRELKDSAFDFENYEDVIVQGGYPRIYDQSIPAEDFYPHYISTYVERDVRQIINIQDLSVFTQFLKLCAGRIGQLLNMQSLSNDVGVSINTIKSWLSVLEASHIIYLFQPYYKNFNKRVVKTKKLYFRDTGLACSLLNIRTGETLNTHYLKGGLFENFVINEMQKYFANKGKQSHLYFWQDKTGKEIDVILEKGAELFPFEIKSARTKNKSLLTNFNYWNTFYETTPEYLSLVYGGDNNFKTTHGNFISWRNVIPVLEKIGN